MKLNKFTFGVSLGVIIGLLIAPGKGSETRKKISETAASLKFKLDELLGKETTDLDELKYLMEDEDTKLNQELRLKLIRLIDKAKKSYEELKKEMA